MSLSSSARVGTTDTNPTSNSRPPSPSYDTTLSGHTGLFPVFQSHALLSPDVRPTPAAQQDRDSRHSYDDSSSMNTPNLSRSTSPLPPFYSTQSSGSDTDSDEPASPLLLYTYAPQYLRGRDPPRWWQRPRRGPRRITGWRFKSIVRVLRRVIRHPFFPKHPSTIVRASFLFSC